MKTRFLQCFWPPALAYFTNRAIELRRAQHGTKTLWAEIKQETQEVVTAISDDATITQFANEVAQSELKRKETIESKASIITQAAGLAVSIAALAPATLGKPWILSSGWTLAALIVYCASLLHLIIGVYYATKARRVRDYTMPSADGFVALLKNSKSQNLKRDLIVQKIAESKWNEDALTIKGNFLSVSEDMFLRGLSFFSVSMVIALLGTAGEVILQKLAF